MRNPLATLALTAFASCSSGNTATFESDPSKDAAVDSTIYDMGVVDAGITEPAGCSLPESDIKIHCSSTEGQAEMDFILNVAARCQEILDDPSSRVRDDLDGRIVARVSPATHSHATETGPVQASDKCYLSNDGKVIDTRVTFACPADPDSGVGYDHGSISLKNELFRMQNERCLFAPSPDNPFGADCVSTGGILSGGYIRDIECEVHGADEDVSQEAAEAIGKLLETIKSR